VLEEQLIRDLSWWKEEQPRADVWSVTIDLFPSHGRRGLFKFTTLTLDSAAFTCWRGEIRQCLFSEPISNVSGFASAKSHRLFVRDVAPVAPPLGRAIGREPEEWDVHLRTMSGKTIPLKLSFFERLSADFAAERLTQVLAEFRRDAPDDPYRD
jgi:hypothetical protein